MKAITTLLLISLGTLGAGAVELKLKWEPGKRYLWSTETTSAASIPLGGEVMKTNSVMVQEMHNDCSKHEKGTKVATKIDRLMMKTSMNGAVAMEYDSKDPAKSGGQMGTLLGPLAKASFATIYDEAGEILEITGLDDLQAAGQMGMGKPELEAMARQSAQFMPDKEVNQGDTWTSEVDLPMGALGTTAKLTYTLKLDEVKEVDGKRIAHISLRGKMKADDKDGASPLTMEAKKVTGMILFDIGLGQPVETRTTIDMEMGVPGQPQGGPADGPAPKMPISATSIQKLTAVEAIPAAEK